MVTRAGSCIFALVPPAGCPRAAGAARFRCVAPLLACCAGKRLRVSSASHPVGFESRHIGSKKPATARVTGSSIQMVPPAGFEPAISTLKGWRPWPLDDGDSGKEYSRLFYPFTYRWQIEKPPHRSGFLFRFSNISICNIWAGKSALSVTDRDGRRMSGRTSHSVTARRLSTAYLLQIETNYRGGSKPPQRCLSPLWWWGVRGGVSSRRRGRRARKRRRGA